MLIKIRCLKSVACTLLRLVLVRTILVFSRHLTNKAKALVNELYDTRTETSLYFSSSVKLKANICSRRKMCQKECERVMLDFTSDWMTNFREDFTPIVVRVTSLYLSTGINEILCK